MMSPIRFTPRNSTRLAKELQPYLRLPLLPPITEVATVGVVLHPFHTGLSTCWVNVCSIVFWGFEIISPGF